MITLQFIFRPRLPGHSANVRVLVKGKPLLVTTVSKAVRYV